MQYSEDAQNIINHICAKWLYKTMNSKLLDTKNKPLRKI